MQQVIHIWAGCTAAMWDNWEIEWNRVFCRRRNTPTRPSPTQSQRSVRHRAICADCQSPDQAPGSAACALTLVFHVSPLNLFERKTNLQIMNRIAVIPRLPAEWERGGGETESEYDDSRLWKHVWHMCSRGAVKQNQRLGGIRELGLRRGTWERWTAESMPVAAGPL